MLSLEDLRFYHQFITTAIPPLPVKAERGWMECAAMSHEVRPDSLIRIGKH